MILMFRRIHVMTKLVATGALLTFLFSNVLANGQVYVNEEQRLKQNLFENYNTDVRPVKDSRNVLKLKFGLAIQQITQVNEKEESLVLSVYLRQFWNDAMINWKPEEYDNLTIINTKPENIWLPDVTLYNNAEKDDNFGGHVDQMTTRAIIDYQGNVTWLSPAIITGKCTMDIRYFPFDEQRCILKFGSWTYHGHFIDMHATHPIVDLTNFDKSSEWSIISAKLTRNVIYYGCCIEPYPDITAVIHLKRKPLFYVLNLLLPMIFIGVLTLLSFFLPSESGERISFAVTLMLALTVFMLIVADMIPASSETVPLLGVFFTAVMIQMVFMVFAMCYTLNLHFRLPEECNRIGKWTRVIVYDFLACKLGVRKDSKKSAIHPMNDQRNGYANKHIELTEESIITDGIVKSNGHCGQCKTSIIADDKSDPSPTSKFLKKSLEMSRQKNEDDDLEKEITREFQICARTFDMLALIVFGFTFALILMIYLLNTNA